MGKKKENNVERISEEELADLFGFDFIAGFTPGGIPYGITKEEAAEQSDENPFIEIEDTDLPF